MSFFSCNQNLDINRLVSRKCTTSENSRWTGSDNQNFFTHFLGCRKIDFFLIKNFDPLVFNPKNFFCSDVFFLRLSNLTARLRFFRKAEFFLRYIFCMKYCEIFGFIIRQNKIRAGPNSNILVTISYIICKGFEGFSLLFIGTFLWEGTYYCISSDLFVLFSSM